ncbi:MAG TPA: response regulator [Bacteroidota bacterium]|nr:response regulator [Bacteroidota bacterium]
MNILLVDDESSYRMLVKHALEEEQWTVFEAENGSSAIDLLHDESIDIIVSDIYMPVMDGLKFHKTVRSIKKFEQVPFLFVSAFDDDYTLGAVQNFRLDGFVRKGKSISFLKEWIRYLTTPESKRSLTPPSSEIKIKPERSSNDRGKGSARSPIL